MKWGKQTSLSSSRSSLALACVRNHSFLELKEFGATCGSLELAEQSNRLNYTNTAHGNPKNKRSADEQEQYQIYKF